LNLIWIKENAAGATRTADLCLLYKVQKWPCLGDQEGTGIIPQMKEGRPAPARAKSKTEANRILREHGFVAATTALETWSFPDRVTNDYHLAEVFVMQLPQQGRSRKKVKSAKKQKSKAGKRAGPKGKRSSRRVRRRSK